MNKVLKMIMVTLAVLVIAAIVFVTVFVLAKQKVIFINKWFVDEKNSTVGVDVSAYQADIDMNVLKEQNVSFIYIKATEGSTGRDGRFAANWEMQKTRNFSREHIISSPMKAAEKRRQRILSIPWVRI